GNVDRDRILVADVLVKRLAGRAVEHDDANHSGEAEEEIVLAALVVVEATNDAATGAREVQLPDRLRQSARAGELREPAAVVRVAREREPAAPFDPPPRLRRTKSLTS